jgi:hypothetical protein
MRRSDSIARSLSPAQSHSIHGTTFSRVRYVRVTYVRSGPVCTLPSVLRRCALAHGHCSREGRPRARYYIYLLRSGPVISDIKYTVCAMLVQLSAAPAAPWPNAPRSAAAPPALFDRPPGVAVMLVGARSTTTHAMPVSHSHRAHPTHGSQCGCLSCLWLPAST